MNTKEKSIIIYNSIKAKLPPHIIKGINNVPSLFIPLMQNLRNIIIRANMQCEDIKGYKSCDLYIIRLLNRYKRIEKKYPEFFKKRSERLHNFYVKFNALIHAFLHKDHSPLYLLDILQMLYLNISKLFIPAIPHITYYKYNKEPTDEFYELVETKLPKHYWDKYESDASFASIFELYILEIIKKINI